MIVNCRFADLRGLLFDSALPTRLTPTTAPNGRRLVLPGLLLGVLLALLGGRAAAGETAQGGASAARSPGLPVLLTVGDDSACGYSDLADAIAAAAGFGPAQHVIAMRSDYDRSVASDIVDQSLYIEGGYDNCTSLTRSGRTTLRAVFGHQIFEITNHGTESRVVTLKNLVLTGAGGSLFGGALDIEGDSLEVRLESVDVVDNSSIFRGGGVEVGDQATLIIDQGTNILRNESYLGGGVSCVFGGRVEFLSGAVAFNVASSEESVARGGGIYATSCDVQVEAGGLLQGVYANRAEEGGGIFAHNGGLVFLQGGSSHPASVSNNFAGGGVWINNQGLGETTLFARNAWINGNVGAGVVLEKAALVMDRSADCHTPDRCNQISFNTREGILGTGVGGGENFINVFQGYIENNGFLGIGSYDQGQVWLTNTVLVSDTPSGIYTNGGDLHITQSTLIGGPSNYQLLSGNLSNQSTIKNSILWRAPSAIYPERAFPIQQTLRIDIECATFDTTSGAPFPSDLLRVFEQDPMFVDFDGGDYHLSPGSPAIDRCEILNNNLYRDIDAQERGFDVPSFGDPSFPDDIGADEFRSDIIQSTPPIFLDGFETGDTSRWSAG